MLLAYHLRHLTISALIFFVLLFMLAQMAGVVPGAESAELGFLADRLLMFRMSVLSLGAALLIFVNKIWGRNNKGNLWVPAASLFFLGWMFFLSYSIFGISYLFFAIAISFVVLYSIAGRYFLLESGF